MLSLEPVRTDYFWQGYADVMRADDSQRAKKMLNWNGLQLGLQYLPGDMRHNRRLTAAYGHVRGTYGMADDGMSFDVWVNLTNPLSRKVFKLQQLTFDGTHDEYKYILGVDTKEEAIALYGQNMPRQLIGRVTASSIAELTPANNVAAAPRTDSFLAGYRSVMRSDFAVEPSQDAVVFRGPGMIVVTLDQPPSPELLREFNMLRDRVSPVGIMGGDRDPVEPFKLSQQSFYIPLRDTFCPDRTSEAIASDLETRYGMRVLRKRQKPSEYMKKNEPEVLTFSPS